MALGCWLSDGAHLLGKGVTVREIGPRSIEQLAGVVVSPVLRVDPDATDAKAGWPGRSLAVQRVTRALLRENAERLPDRLSNAAAHSLVLGIHQNENLASESES